MAPTVRRKALHADKLEARSVKSGEITAPPK
jgi:hypothetical protein